MKKVAIDSLLPFVLFEVAQVNLLIGVVVCGVGVMYLTSPDIIGLQLGKAYYPCSR